MILTVDSGVAARTSRRQTANGWHTTFIGKNRNTLQPGEAAPESDTLYPMAFLVEKEAGAVVKPHFHQADQFQVVVSGGGKLGIHSVDGIAVHYTDPYTAYGPIKAADDGIAWFTLRNAWDPGAKYMPGARAELRAARDRFQHGEAVTPPLDILPEAERRAASDVVCLTEMEGEDGLGVWRYRVPADAALTGPAPGTGGGQFWIVLGGEMIVGAEPAMPPNSCVFVGPQDEPLAARAGASGLEIMCLQFKNRARD